MASTQQLIGLFGVALLLARAAAALGAGSRRWWLAAIGFAFAWAPVAGLPVAGYVRGISGDLSVTTIVLLMVALAGTVSPGERRVLSIGIVASALFLYPLALGIGGFDPYRLGFAPGALLVVSGVAALAAWLRQYHVVLACIVVAVTSHALALMTSSNLWDYLVDPWIVLVSIYDLRPRRRKT